MDIKIPQLGEGAESGTVASIFVKEGDTVEKDQALIELESEKAVASIPSTATGKITKIHVKEGDEVRVGSVIVSIETDGRPAAPKAEPGKAEPRKDEPKKERPKPPPVEEKPPPAERKEEAPPEPEREERAAEEPAAAPSIRKIARELGIDLRRIRGSARGGRIVIDDLRNYIARLQKAAEAAAQPEKAPRPTAPAIDFSRWGPVRTYSASPVRKTIASRMTESWTTIPHVTQFADADITELLEHRRKYVPVYKEKNARLTLTPLVLRALIAALARHPILNSSLDEASGNIVTKEYYHIGLAVDTDAGLIVPVIRDVDRKSVYELALEIEELTERTRQRKVSKDEMQGGTFTVSNQGGIGGAHFTPIINKPEVAILGLGRAREVLRHHDGGIEPRIMLPLAVSHDHRVVDGADGVRFLVELVEKLERFPESELKID